MASSLSAAELRQISTHSLRKDGATAAVESGMPIHALKGIGSWRSPLSPPIVRAASCLRFDIVFNQSLAPFVPRATFQSPHHHTALPLRPPFFSAFAVKGDIAVIYILNVSCLICSSH